MNTNLYRRPNSSQGILFESTQPIFDPSSTLYSQRSERLKRTVPISQVLSAELTKPTSLPDSSQYNILQQYPTRPKTSHLSGFTLEENQKKTIQSISISRLIYQASESEKVFKPKLPSEKDFSSLLSKLEIVSSNRTSGYKRISLNDNDSADLILEAGQTQYFSIDVKGKRPPLQITIKRTKGKLRGFLSKTHSEPNEGCCDIQFRNDNYQFTDFGLRFKADLLFLGLQAVTETVFVVSVKFGRKRLKIDSKGLTDTQSIQGFAQTLNFTSKDFSLKKAKKKQMEKDFIKLNIEGMKKRISLAATDRTGSAWLLKRESVMKKKRQQILEKKARILSVLNKKSPQLSNR